MLECLILGDSIAVGTKMFAPRECVSYSQGGINSRQWNRRWGGAPLEAETVVISLGTNDHLGIRTERELRRLRSRVISHRVVWIMPPCSKRFCNPHVNARVSRVAFDFGDRTISTDRLQGDGIHPTASGYRQLVRRSGI
jgi:lysophospholipase L1-like esterase